MRDDLITFAEACRLIRDAWARGDRVAVALLNPHSQAGFVASQVRLQGRAVELRDGELFAVSFTADAVLMARRILDKGDEVVIAFLLDTGENVVLNLRPPRWHRRFRPGRRGRTLKLKLIRPAGEKTE